MKLHLHLAREHLFLSYRLQMKQKKIKISIAERNFTRVHTN